MVIDIENWIDLKYAGAQVLATYVVLGFIIKHPKTIHKHISSFLVGCLLGAIWYIKLHTAIDTLIISFLVAVAFYDKLISPILEHFGVKKYHNGKGIIK